MRTSPRGVAFIAAHEGVVTKSYRDDAGVLTIGVGHTAAAGPPVPKAGMTITRDEAMRILADDLPRYERDVTAAIGPVSEPAFDGAVSFHFNTGAIRRATWVKTFRAGAHSVAEASLKEWTKSGGRILKGLVRRRQEEADLIFRLRYPQSLTGEGVLVTDPAERAALEKALGDLGYLEEAGRGDDGILIGAIRRFQKDHRLVVDGIAGPATRATLERALAARVAGGAVIGAGGAGAAAGGIDAAGDAAGQTGAGDVVFGAVGWAAAAMAIVGMAGLAWRYRGAIALFFMLRFKRTDR